MEALAERGHQIRVVTRVEAFGVEAHDRIVTALSSRGVQLRDTHGPGIQYWLNGVDIRVLSRNAHLRAFFAAHIHAFDPDVILTSTDDPGQLLLEVALRAPRARVVYLVRATIAAPFGPESSLPNETKAAVLRNVDGVVAVSEYVAAYARRWGGLDAVHVPISLLPPGDAPLLGRFDNPFVGMVNPCAGKGISIFLALADRFPETGFAAIPTWGTTEEDLTALRRRANISVLPQVDDFDDFLRSTRVMLVPSLWAEARSRVILEAMSRGIPVMASDVGGLAEAKLGVDYLLPVNPVERYRPSMNELMVPAADIPEQNLKPWEDALGRLLRDRRHWEALSCESRRAALEYNSKLSARPLEAYLEGVVRTPGRRTPEHMPRRRSLSPEKRRLLARRWSNRGAADVEPNA